MNAVPAALSEHDAQALTEVLREGEGWLMQRTLDFAEARAYTQYTSTLLEAWRLSVAGLTESVETAMRLSLQVPELGPDLDPVTDPLARFGVEEAQRHRQRGVNLAMFLGLFKYYRQAYVDLLDQAAIRAVFDDPATVHLYVARVFDRTEIAYTSAWAGTTAEQQIRDLSIANRDTTNEKNRLLTLIESLTVPAFLSAEDGSVEFMNHQAALLLSVDSIPGGTHYGQQPPPPQPDWLKELIANLGDSPRQEVEVALSVHGAPHVFIAHLSRLVDVSHKNAGYAVVLLDVTVDREHRRELMAASEVFTGTRDGVVVLDPHGRVAAANPAFASLLGVGPDELTGRPIDEFLALPLSLSDASIPEVLADGGHWTGEVTLASGEESAVTGWLSLSQVGWGDETAAEIIGIFTDITPLKDAQQRLAHLARYDGLTGLANRTELRDLLESVVASAVERGQRVGILFLDLDRFKEINDTLGHAAGDDVLAKVAERLREALRGDDILGRLGGDEFMIVAEDLSRAEQAELVATRALRSLEQPIRIGSQDYGISASIGISVFPDDGLTVDELIRNADSAMYLAKEQGRSTYRRYVPTLTEEAHRRLVLGNALRRDVATSALQLFYQPIVSLHERKVTGVEALLRWFPPELGEIAPSTTIPMLEDLGLIGTVGAWALEAATAQLADWMHAGVPLPLVAVNVAPSQLEDSRFTQLVRDCLERHGLQSSHLQLEVTESTIFRARGRGSAVLRALHEHGVTVAIDDFGTGYSSLGRLSDLPISVLKIDRSFVTEFTTSPEHAARTMVSAIATLAHSLELTVTAEGVESASVAESLRAIGCERAQGFAYAAPMPADAIPAFIASFTDGRVDSIPAPANKHGD